MSVYDQNANSTNSWLGNGFKCNRKPLKSFLSHSRAAEIAEGGLPLQDRTLFDDDDHVNP